MHRVISKLAHTLSEIIAYALFLQKAVTVIQDGVLLIFSSIMSLTVQQYNLVEYLLLSNCILLLSELLSS